MLHRFAGVVSGDTLYKAYRVAIEPIALYGMEIIYKNLTDIVLKKYNHLEFSAIKVSYQLPRTTPVVDCLQYLAKEGVAGRINSRRDNFIQKNKSSTVLRHGETLTYSQGRRICVKITHSDRSSRTNSWKHTLRIHKPNLFLSDMDCHHNHKTHNSDTLSLSKCLHPENFPTLPNTTRRITPHHLPHANARFTIKPAYIKRELFTPPNRVANSIKKRQSQCRSPLLRIPFPLPPDIYTLGGQPSVMGSRSLFDPG